MTNTRSVTIAVIVLDFFILVGAGHGLGCLGLLEAFWMVALLTGHSSNDDFALFSFAGSYEHSLGAAALLSLLGQVLLLLSLRVKEQFKTRLRILGLFLLGVGYYCLIRSCLEDPASQLSLFSGIPFLISSGILIYRICRCKRGA